ncbi:Transposable element tcb2 transposase [Caligus rogercresseyi]|uniref:Transposable element tcb2 transposase n=1 Tax=Caligus rogercresseyi TaxID=217165 RepID=A0A7T8GNE2_CALRO|nr:Transposable element tcb2 transposase [Caligus rogercresseyi]
MMLIKKALSVPEGHQDREFVAQVKRKVNEDGNKSSAKLATEMGCSMQTIANTINKDLGFCSYKKRHRIILTEGTRESRRDSAPAHKSRETQVWLFESLPYHWSPDLWPPSSPDCNPLDYFFWGMVENKTDKHAHNTLDSLRATIVEEFANMRKDVVDKACGRFRLRLKMVVAADEGYIEK